MFRAERLGRDAAGRLFAGDWFHCAPDGGNDRQIPAKKVEADWAASGRGDAEPIDGCGCQSSGERSAGGKLPGERSVAARREGGMRRGRVKVKQGDSAMAAGIMIDKDCSHQERV